MRARRLIGTALLLSAVTSACSGSGSTPETTVAPASTGAAPPETIATPSTLPPGAAVCDAYVDVTEAGRLGDPDLTEVSGVAASRRHEDVLWIHNDSRGGPRLYGIMTTGELVASWELDGAGALDWEDIAAGPGPEPGGSYLYVGDIGDNFGIRPNITVYRFPEPDLALDGSIDDFERIRLRYPDPGHNAEALAVDPVTGDVIIVTKDREGPDIVFVAPSSELESSPVDLRELVRLELGARSQVTAADFSPTGERFALRGYSRVWMWPRTSVDLAGTLVGEPCRAASPNEVQGEALAFATDSLRFFTISEGSGAPVHEVGVAK